MKFTILGCGSSMGVPRSDGFFGKCNPKNKKNYRTRCSAILQTKTENILFDASPDLRFQLMKKKINKIDKVFFSHMHADQTHGINDLRVFYIRNRKPIPVFTDNITKKYLLKTFNYCFFNRNKQYPATLKLNLIKKDIKILNGNDKILIKSIKVKHGNVDSICFIIDRKLAYISDVNHIYQKDYRYFSGLNYLVLDCLRYLKHPSHFNLEECLNLVKILKPKKTILTNLHSDLDYNDLKKKLPKNIIPAHDGLSLRL